MKVCATSGCPELTEGTYCDTHRKQKRKASDAKRPNARQRGYGVKWQRTRSLMLTLCPTCQCGEQATEVHHIDGLGPNGPRGHDYFNLEPLCKSCHSKRTATNQPGGFNG